MYFRDKVRWIIVHLSVVFLLAFFFCAGTQMIMQDTGILQMQNFSKTDSQILKLIVPRETDRKLVQMANLTGESYGALLATVMLKNGQKVDKEIYQVEILADMAGYRRQETKKFEEISSYYNKMTTGNSFLPLAAVYSEKEKLLYDPVKVINEEMKIDEQLWITISLVSDWQEIVPVVCMKNGIITGIWEESGVCIEQENGIRIIYKGIGQWMQSWSTGTAVKAGVFLGTAKELKLQFQISDGQGNWIPFNGMVSLWHTEGVLPVQWSEK